MDIRASTVHSVFSPWGGAWGGTPRKKNKLCTVLARMPICLFIVLECLKRNGEYVFVAFLDGIRVLSFTDLVLTKFFPVPHMLLQRLERPSVESLLRVQ